MRGIEADITVANARLTVVIVAKCSSSITGRDIKASVAASVSTVSQNPVNTMTIEMRPNARGPNKGACTAKSASPNSCVNEVWVVTQNVDENLDVDLAVDPVTSRN